MTPQQQRFLLMQAIAGQQRRQQTAAPQAQQQAPALQKGEDGKYTLGGMKTAFVGDIHIDLARDKKLQKALGIEDVFKKEFKQGEYMGDGGYVDSTAGPELQKALSRYQHAIVHLNKDVKQSHYIDRETGQIVYSDKPRERNAGSLSKGIKTVAPFALAMFGGPLAGSLGKAVGLTGTAAAAAGGAGLAGLSSAAMGARGSDIWKAALTGGLGAGIGAYGSGAGWNPALTKVASRTVPGLLSGRDPRQLLMNAAIGQVTPAGNPFVNRLLQTIIKQRVGGRG